MARTKKIGVFDSGFGGLAILKDVVRTMPRYDYVYLGDNARTPYGTRSSAVVYQFTKEAVDFLFAHGCDLVILACNTASADALRKIQQEYLPKRYSKRRRVLGVIVQALEEALERTKNNRIGVIATEGTVASGTFVRELRARSPKTQVFQSSAPLLVPLVEAGEHRSQACALLLKQYIVPLLKRNIDTLILGCTHYGHLEQQVKKIVGNNASVISEGPVIAKKLKDYLARHPEVESVLSRTSKCHFYTTDMSERFRKLGKLFFGRPISPKKISLA